MFPGFHLKRNHQNRTDAEPTRIKRTSIFNSPGDFLSAVWPHFGLYGIVSKDNEGRRTLGCEIRRMTLAALCFVTG